MKRLLIVLIVPSAIMTSFGFGVLWLATARHDHLFGFVILMFSVVAAVLATGAYSYSVDIRMSELESEVAYLQKKLENAKSSPARPPS